MAFSPTDKQIIVNYHYVEDPRADFSGIFPCSIADFDRQIKFLSENYKIVSIPEVCEAARNGSAEKTCAITFDDGLRDQYENAVPILDKYNAKAVFFIITQTFLGRVPSAHKLHVAMSRIGVIKLIDGFNDFLSLRPQDAQKYFIPKDWRVTEKRVRDDIPTANLKETLTLIPNDLRDDFLDEVFRRSGIDETRLASELFMDKDQIVHLARRGFWVESHTHNHVSLEIQTADFLRQDFKLSNKLLTDLLSYTPKILSFPYGRHSQILLDVMKEAGFTHGVTTQPRAIEAGDQPFLLPRFDTKDIREYLNK